MNSKDRDFDPQNQLSKVNQDIQELTLMNDSFMSLCFDGHIPSIQLVLRIILNKPDLVVENVTTQKWIQNIKGRSVKLDILAKDSTGTLYNIEVQVENSGSSELRSRFYSSMMDKDFLDKGKDFEELPKSFVIFITDTDVFGKGRPVYRFGTTDLDDGTVYKDKRYIYYVNGAYQDESSLGKLMQDFHCPEPSKMHYKELADRINYFKDEGGKKDMYASLFPRALAEVRKDVEKNAQRNLLMKQIEHLRSKGKSWDETKDSLCLTDDLIQNLELDVPLN